MPIVEEMFHAPSYAPVRKLDDHDVSSLASRFAGAEPFPHVVIDDVVNDHEIAAAMPSADWDGWSHYEDAYQSRKRICSDLSRIPRPLREIIEHFHSPEFLEQLSAITGIEKLIPDPYLDGGGLHVTGEGGTLAPHSDFHTYARLGLFRQVNLLLYLNPDWDDDGGELELFGDADATNVVARVTPEFGRCVIFRTDDRSVHGFTRPVTSGTDRKSIALYYYTSAESGHYGGTTTTMWRHHPEHHGASGIRLRLYRGLLFVSRALSWLAHKAHPERMSTGGQ